MVMRTVLRRVGSMWGAPARRTPSDATEHTPGSTAPTSSSTACNWYLLKRAPPAKFCFESCGEYLLELFQSSACVNWIESAFAMSE